MNVSLMRVIAGCYRAIQHRKDPVLFQLELENIEREISQIRKAYQREQKV